MRLAALPNATRPETDHAFRYDLCAAALLGAGLVLRIVLLLRDWPALNSDEATMGLMARHIAFAGAHPVYFYGQAYMGALEAYLAAPLFVLFGPSAVALRIGLVLMVGLFMATSYLLTVQIWNRRVGLATLAILALGTNDILLRQLTAVGGAVETLLFGSLLMLLATRLALTPGAPRRGPLFAAWGLAAGLGFWSHLLILPSIAASAGLLVLGCSHAPRRGAIALMLGGLLLGSSPALAYDLAHARHAGTVSMLYSAFRDSGQQTQGATPGPQVAGALLVSLPLATGGGALCSLSPRERWPVSPRSSPHVILCTALHGLWSATLIALWGLSGLLAARRLRPLWRMRGSLSPPARRTAVRLLGHLALLLGAGLTVALYMLSPAAALQPDVTSRYLVGVAIALPAVLAPLVGAELPGARAVRPRLPLRAGSYGLVLALVGVLALGTRSVLTAGADWAHWKVGQEQALVSRLLQMHATRIYTDYWSCDRIAFQSGERIVCSVLDDRLRSGLDRYLPYRAAVRRASALAYVFPVGSPQAAALARRAGLAHVHYSRTEVAGYVVYQPLRRGHGP